MKVAKLFSVFWLTCCLMLAGASSVRAAEELSVKDQAKLTSAHPPTTLVGGSALGAGLGMGLALIGAGIGLSRIAAAAMESMARQPEVAGRINGAMIIVAAMLEGATLAAVVFCLLIGNNAQW
jgi:F-type H+-transporting ATPase subunit c